MIMHPTAFEQAEKALAGVNHHHPTDIARCAVNAAAPVLFALWDVQALRSELDDLRAENSRLRAELYAERFA